MISYSRVRKALFGSFVLCAVVALGVPVALAQAKLEPLPLYEQCVSLQAGAAPSATLNAQLAQLKSASGKLREEAVQQLSKACQRQAVEPLLDLLKDPDLPVRLAAIETLGRLGDKDSIDPLVELASDPDWRIRLALVPALGSFKVFRAKNTVLNTIVNPNDAVVSEEPDMRVRCVGILTLNQLADVQFSRKAVQFMYHFLRSNQLNLRQLAEQTMLALKDTRNGPAELNGILKQHNDPEMRRWAALWLGNLQIERGRQALEEAAANDKAPAVKFAATEALAKLNRAAK
jgi:HEAT repeat protein